MTFADLKLDDQLLEAIGYMGYEKPSPIQEKVIPDLLLGHDAIACAQTGTGKTAAFLLPVLNDLILNPSDKTTTLIIAPTRELALQIDQQIQGFAYFAGVDSIAIYGGGKGTDFEIEKRALSQGTNIIVATPGKLKSHMNLGYVDFSQLRHLILDEADRMFDMGFINDITAIIKQLPEKRQTIMFSATMAKDIRGFALKFLKDPKETNLAIGKPAEGIAQSKFLAFDEQKIDILVEELQKRENYDSIIVFTSTKSKVNGIYKALKRHFGNVKAISSDLEQDEREKVMLGFRAKKTRILVATDVISRGIDIKDINLVVNYDVPPDPADYVHRVGRTARANTKGEAITLVNAKDIRRFDNIQKLIEKEVETKPTPEELGPAPEWKFESKKKKKPWRKKSGNRNQNRPPKQN